ncbi:hypothetical protein HORIV_64390 [Vreelandella olivaria]|uniref:DUF112 domain-containing protein n=1 Tax=Vreelandella olivaria TaxID=390919 RepID=A0ABN5X5A6_9GAMM|nr:hypothetical protein HORIV_64390 [Halomonas olivaria]
MRHDRLFSLHGGADPITGADRFTFGSYALSSGLTLIPVVVGAFALSEIFVRFASRDDPSAKIPEATLRFPKLGEWFKRLTELVRGSLIGSFIGALPGTGAAAAAFISYATAQSCLHAVTAWGRASRMASLLPSHPIMQ